MRRSTKVRRVSRSGGTRLSWRWLLAGLLLLSLVAAACAPEEDDPEVADPDDEEEVDTDEEPDPIDIRFVADFPPPPHPAGIAMEEFQRRLPEELPGSSVEIFYAGALYDIPEAFEAMADGSLEMTFLQLGKAAPVEPMSLVVTGPGLTTTIGAVEAIEESETIQMLEERYEEQHGVRSLGLGHMSHGMGMAGPERYAGDMADYQGDQIRSMGPVENVVLEAWGASPTTMDFGEVPSAVEAGVIEGMMTSIGGWSSIIDIAPYYTTGEGPGAFTGDYYFYTASLAWWDSLDETQQQALETLFEEEIRPFQKEINYCVDQFYIEQYGTEDPDEPGIYLMTDDELEPLWDELGDSIEDFVKAETPDEADEWVDRFVEEAAQASEDNPVGESWIEEIDCEAEGHFDTIQRAEEEDDD
jgi:TRAP-type C4-dicarboxylate transport system substrate-binding protein